MKSFLLTTLAALASGVITAQTFEIGLNGGMSTTTKPNNVYYKGDNNVWTPAYGVSFLYNFHERWQVGLTAGLTKFQRTSQWPITGTFGDSLSTEDIDFILAERAVNVSVQLNHVVPFYNRYEDFVRSSLYFGVSAGALFTGNDGKIVYSRVNPNTPIEFTYASQYHFERGYGYTVGLQIGYNYYFGERVGVNLDFAPKYASIKTVDPRFNHANNEFDLFYFPVTVGLRFRFGGYR